MNTGNDKSSAQASLNEIISKMTDYESCLIKADQFESTMSSKMKTFNAVHGFSQPDYQISQMIGKHKKEYDSISNKVSNIKEKVDRNTIKISIFGKVSVGKSKVLNAVLHRDLFLSAPSHTTSCFVKINKSCRPLHHYVTYGNKTENYTELKGLQTKVKELSTDLEETNKSRLQTSASVNVFLDIKDNKILRSNTQIVDSPGSSNKDEITRCIEMESVDADIFIFVMSHCLTSQDIDFFRFQSQQSSKPDIFVLINGWDNSDNDRITVTEKSRESITKDLVRFLTSEGGLKEDEARRRIFFISAKEMFQHRIDNKNMLDPQNKHFLAKKRRFDEFIRFEDALSSYIDQPQINKCQRHISEIKEVSRQLLKTGREFITAYKIIRAQLLSRKSGLDKTLESLKDSNVKITSRIKQWKSSIFKEISSKYNCFIGQLNMDNINYIADDINNYTATILQSITTLQRDTNTGISDMEPFYRHLMATCDLQQKVPKPTLKEVLSQNTIVQVFPKTPCWKSFIMSFAELISMFIPIKPIISAILSPLLGLYEFGAGNEAITKNKHEARIRDENVANINAENKIAIQDNENENKQILEKNKSKILEKKDVAITTTEEFARSLESHVAAENQQMQQALQSQIDFYDKYSKEIFNICEKLKIFQ